jgi:hypothetical protein
MFCDAIQFTTTCSCLFDLLATLFDLLVILFYLLVTLFNLLFGFCFIFPAIHIGFNRYGAHVQYLRQSVIKEGSVSKCFMLYLNTRLEEKQVFFNPLFNIAKCICKCRIMHLIARNKSNYWIYLDLQII